MANIKDLKNKIRSTKSTLKITSAMKLVSAAKLSRAQGKITGAKPYVNELDDTIKVVSALSESYSHPLIEKNKGEKYLVVVISSNRGLCGPFNTNLAKTLVKFKNDHQNVEIDFRFLGRKVRELVASDVNTEYSYETASQEPSYNDSLEISQELDTLYRSHEYGKVFVAYNEFFSAINICPQVQQVLPIAIDDSQQEEVKEKFPFDFKYEPQADIILNRMIPQAFHARVYACVLNSLASEHGSRMTAMDNATKNSKEMIKKLTLKMNKLRQAAITTELIEVVSGAESLN